MSSACTPAHDWFSDVLTGGLILGLCISYAPQHYRIISKGSSEGFSPWFLLLGSTSSASGMLNIIVMQQAIIRCCRVLYCLETVAGVIQVGMQWLLFSVILVLYIIYFPPHLKYVTLDIVSHDSQPPERVKTNLKSDNWRLSIILSWIVFIHLAFCTFVTFVLILDSPVDPSGSVRPQLRLWATFLGVSSAVLAALQYAPQIVHTYHLKLVGALSVPMMMIQTPGGFSHGGQHHDPVGFYIDLQAEGVSHSNPRPGTNWTTWIMFLVAAIMQGILLTLCICWKVRQRRLHIDDFGHPLGIEFPPPEPPITHESEDRELIDEALEDTFDEDLVSISHEEAELAPLLRDRRKRSKRRKVVDKVDRNHQVTGDSC
ncbi:hypothetical protein EDB83DRAFT_2636141 [Lactarius deliciosus]|nr:hypothetical protein EDB83DRAFT_2636141 [Lactarius deliciosus]